MSPVNAFLSISSFLFPLSPSVSLSLAFRLPALTPGVISRKTIFTLMCVLVCVRVLPAVCGAFLRGCMKGVRCMYAYACVCTWAYAAYAVCQFFHVKLLREYISMQYMRRICPWIYTVCCIFVHKYVCAYELIICLRQRAGTLLGTCYLYPGKKTIAGAKATRRTHKLCLIQGLEHQKDTAHKARSFWESEGQTELTSPPQKTQLNLTDTKT